MSQIESVASDPLLASLIQGVPLPVAGAILHKGRTKIYDLLGKGKLDAVKDGSRTLITIASIRRYQSSLPPATFKPPKPPRLENLDKLHEKQRQRAERRRAARRRSKARA
jgi:hypothetical protein